jgi:hypothetical protein
MACHVGGEVNYGDKSEEIAEKIDKIRDKIEVIVKNNGFKRSLFRNEFVNIF